MRRFQTVREAPLAMAARAADRRFDFQSQQAGVISNVAGDQYNQHALQMAPMRRRARTVMRTGFALLFAGFGVFVLGFALFADSIVKGANEPAVQGPNMTGWLIAGAGSATAALGLIVVVASLFMKRGSRREEQQP